MSLLLMARYKFVLINSRLHRYFENINISCPLLDKDLHTFEWVRVHSTFLFTAVICVTARFFRGGLETRSDVQLPFPPTQAKSIHHRCLSLARKHMVSAFHTALATLDVIQATALLAIWKEADDDRASHHFNRVSRLWPNPACA